MNKAFQEWFFDFNTGMGWGESEGMDHQNRRVHLSVYATGEFYSDEELSEFFKQHWLALAVSEARKRKRPALECE